MHTLKCRDCKLSQPEHEFKLPDGKFSFYCSTCRAPRRASPEQLSAMDSLKEGWAEKTRALLEERRREEVTPPRGRDRAP